MGKNKKKSIYAVLSRRGQTIPSIPSNQFRAMCYNIYMGGRDSVGRNAVIKHIKRAKPDVFSIQEAGDINVITPLLENEGFEHFYGDGGTYGMYFASKYPITYSNRIHTVQWHKPLYAEVDVNGYTVGIVSVHLESGCGDDLCHYEDYLNTPPREPAAQKRTIQMYNIMAFLNDRKATNPSLKGFVIQGDYNAIHNEANVLEYTAELGDETLPSGMSYPIANEQFPYKQFEFYSGTLALDTNPSVNGLTYTWWDDDVSPNPFTPSFEHRLDYIAYSDDLTLLGSEILNSRSDASLPRSGLRKYGSHLLEEDGYVASDHTPVIADFRIEE